MARIFTTRFLFNHQHYDAIVTVSNKNGEMVFTIRVIDQDLEKLLPEGGVAYTGKNGFTQMANLDNTVLQSILRSVARSIDTHLETT